MGTSYRGVEQLAARKAHNLEVVGSSPTPATKEYKQKVTDFSPLLRVLFFCLLAE